MSHPRRPTLSLIAVLLALFTLVALPQWASAQPVVFLDRDYNPNVTGSAGSVTTTAWQADGKLLIGGDFTGVGGVSRSKLARLNPDGSLDTNFAGATVINALVSSILPLPNGDILIGGHFTQVGSPALQVREGLARLKPDGSLDAGYVPPLMEAGSHGRVYRLLRLSSGKIMVSGGFTDFGTPGRNLIARLNADGTLDTTFQSVAFDGPEVRDMLEQADGKLVIAGQFQSVGGQTHHNIARLTTTGAVDASFVIGTNIGSYVSRVLMQPDGKLLIAGNFTQIIASDHGASVSRLARFNMDLSVDATFQGGANNDVRWMERQVDGKLLIGGGFDQVRNASAWIPRSKLARLMPDGSPDEGFVPPDINNWVFALTQQPDGRVIVGGNFSSIGGATRNAIARMVQMEPLAPAQTIAAGTVHSCTVKNGQAVCWGTNFAGALGDGTTTMYRRFAGPVAGLDDGVTAIDSSSTGFSTCAIHRDAAKCWGPNDYGQLGDGTTIMRLAPVQVSGLISGIVAINVGRTHACAVTTAGVVWCWGNNEHGQLGDGSTLHRYTPVQVSGLPGSVVTISTGHDHSCAVITGGAAWCWGNNNSGQLGDGTTTQRLAPVQVSGLESGIQAISAGYAHTCALTTGGAVQCWGLGDSGQLGNSTNTSSSHPVQVSGLTSGVQAISAGTKNTCASQNGAAKCWGNNEFGNLGDNTNTSRNAPVQVVGLGSGIQAIGAGPDHSCAIHNGTAKCWGANYEGQLGNYLDVYHSRTPSNVMTPLPRPTLSIFANGFEP